MKTRRKPFSRSGQSVIALPYRPLSGGLARTPVAGHARHLWTGCAALVGVCSGSGSVLAQSTPTTLDLAGTNVTLPVPPQFGQGVLSGTANVTNSGANATLTEIGTQSEGDCGYGCWRYGGAITDGAGTVAIVHNGGTTQLTGTANTYSGATTVNGGTWQAGVAGAFSPNSNLVINTGGTVDLGGYAQTVNNITLNGGSIVSGTFPTNGGYSTSFGTLTGNMTSAGGSFAASLVGTSSFTNTSGTTTFLIDPGNPNGSGSNTYSGATTINGGTIKAGGSYLFSQGSAYTINAGGTLDMGGYAQFVGSFSGTGTITSTGNGNTYPVSLIIEGTSTFAGQIKDGDSPIALELNGGYGATGTPAQNVTLSGTNNTFSGGVRWGQNEILTLTNANAAGTGTLDMLTGATLAFSGTGYTLANNILFDTYAEPTIDTGSGAITLAGVISGNGQLVKVGSGTLTLDGINTFAFSCGGGTNCTTPAQTAATDVQAGTLVVGDQNTPTAVLPGVVQVETGATVAGYGTITGDLSNLGTVQPGGGSTVGTLTVQGKYTQSATANLVIAVTPAGSSMLKVGGAATLAGTVTFAYAPGTYAAKTYTFLSAASVGGTFSTVATATEGGPPTGFNQSVSYTPTTANLVLASNTPVTPADNRIVSTQLFAFSRLNQDAVDGLLSRSLDNGGGNSFYNIAPLGGPASRAWVRLIGNYVSGTKDGSLAGLSAWSGGFETGIDTTVGAGGRLGVAVGYEASSSSDRYGGKGREDILRVSLYGSQTLGMFGFSGVVSYAHGWADSRRADGMGTAYATRGDNGVVGAAQVSVPFTALGWILTPAAGVTVSHTGSAGFTEQDVANPTFAVSGTTVSQTVASPYALVGFSRAFTTADKTTFTPDFQVGYRRAAEAAPQVNLIASDGTAFAGNRVDPARNSALVGASLTAQHGNWAGFIKYRATFAGNWSSQTVSAGLRLSF